MLAGPSPVMGPHSSVQVDPEPTPSTGPTPPAARTARAEPALTISVGSDPAGAAGTGGAHKTMQRVRAREGPSSGCEVPRQTQHWGL